MNNNKEKQVDLSYDGDDEKNYNINNKSKILIYSYDGEGNKSPNIINN